MQNASKCRVCGSDIPQDLTSDICRACVARESGDDLADTIESVGGPDDAPAATTPAAGFTVNLAPSADLVGLRLLEPVGRGGMGVVWRAEQIATGREVAVKLLRTRHRHWGCDTQARARFQREIELAARLDHPHIARVFDGGESDGEPYCVMEFVEGVPLTDYVRAAALDRRGVLSIFRLICEAVEHAHRRGVIHRDLKPGNILVNSSGEPKLLDFGLAKAMEAEPGAASTLSLEGMVAGTPSYMSPEQAAGHLQDLDTRTDVYSLGVILYQLLVGRLPHDPEGAPEAVARRVADTEIIRPRQADPTLGAELEMLLLRALARRADERYASAQSLGDEIGRYLGGVPLEAGRADTWYFTRKWVIRRKWWVSGALAGCLILSGAAGYHLRTLNGQIRETERQRSEAMVERDHARQSALYNSAMVLADQGDLRLSFSNLRRAMEYGFQWEHGMLLNTLSNNARDIWQLVAGAEAGDTVQAVSFAGTNDRMLVMLTRDRILVHDSLDMKLLKSGSLESPALRVAAMGGERFAILGADGILRMVQLPTLSELGRSVVSDPGQVVCLSVGNPPDSLAYLRAGGSCQILKLPGGEGGKPKQLFPQVRPGGRLEWAGNHQRLIAHSGIRPSRPAVITVSNGSLGYMDKAVDAVMASGTWVVGLETPRLPLPVPTADRVARLQAVNPETGKGCTRILSHGFYPGDSLVCVPGMDLGDAVDQWDASHLVIHSEDVVSLNVDALPEAGLGAEMLANVFQPGEQKARLRTNRHMSVANMFPHLEEVGKIAAYSKVMSTLCVVIGSRVCLLEVADGSRDNGPVYCRGGREFCVGKRGLYALASGEYNISCCAEVIEIPEDTALSGTVSHLLVLGLDVATQGPATAYGQASRPKNTTLFARQVFIDGDDVWLLVRHSPPAGKPDQPAPGIYLLQYSLPAETRKSENVVPFTRVIRLDGPAVDEADVIQDLVVAKGMATVRTSANVRRFALSDGKLVDSIPLRRPVFCQNGDFAGIRSDGRVAIRKASSGVEQVLDISGAEVLQFRPGGLELFVAGNGEIRVVDLSQAVPKEIRCFKSPCLPVAVSNDGGRLVGMYPSASSESPLVLVDAFSGTELCQLSGSGSSDALVMFSANDRRLSLPTGLGQSGVYTSLQPQDAEERLNRFVLPVANEGIPELDRSAQQMMEATPALKQFFGELRAKRYMIAQPSTWTQAQRLARNLGGELLSMDTMAERLLFGMVLSESGGSWTPIHALTPDGRAARMDGGKIEGVKWLAGEIPPPARPFAHYNANGQVVWSPNPSPAQVAGKSMLTIIEIPLKKADKESDGK